jgi:L-seryl-tRNA(Ser) seleniumtransferase
VTDLRRSLPSVARLLEQPRLKALLETAPRNLVVAATREVVDSVRSGGSAPEDWAEAIEHRVRGHLSPSLHPVLNATGVVLHTNLGRAPLAAAAVAAIQRVAEGYSNLELDVASGSRGSRSDHCASLLAGLVGSEDALVVNNAAGALLLALNTIATGKEVLISRGELIEIGGSFRIPDVLEKSGATLREVGTTNRTSLADYRAALGPRTGAILTVHRSNFQQSGFVATPAPRELAGLAHEAGLPYVYDVGSGLLVDLERFGLRDEPRVDQAVQSGADLVAFSGDKLLGGPQAGCLVGTGALIEAARRNPLARALRADKLTLAALEATLALYRDPEVALREIPVLRMLTISPEELEQRAKRLADAINQATETPRRPDAETTPGESAAGGGAFPAASLPTTVVALEPRDGAASGLAQRLRLGKPSVIARIQDDRVVLDPRTLPDSAIPEVAAAVIGALSPE